MASHKEKILQIIFYIHLVFRYMIFLRTLFLRKVL